MQVTQDLTDTQGDKVAVNNQLLTVRQELEGADVGELANRACPVFSGRQLDDPPQLSRNFKLWIATKKLSAHTPVAGAVPADAERKMAEIAYFAFTLRDAANIWFNGLTNNQVAGAGVTATLDALLAAFQQQFAFVPAQKWRYLSKFFKTKQDTGEKSENFLRRVQEAGLKARANDEQIRYTILEEF